MGLLNVLHAYTEPMQICTATAPNGISQRLTVVIDCGAVVSITREAILKILSFARVAIFYIKRLKYMAMERSVTAPQQVEDTDQRLQKLYHVIILNDDEHTFDYVIEMLQSIFGLSMSAAMARTMEADSTGSSIVGTYPLEEAED